LVFVEIVAKKKGCMLCDLALAVLEEIAPEFEEGILAWEVVDMGTKEGLFVMKPWAASAAGNRLYPRSSLMKKSPLIISRKWET
jgi:hypothetical protein